MGSSAIFDSNYRIHIFQHRPICTGIHPGWNSLFLELLLKYNSILSCSTLKAISLLIESETVSSFESRNNLCFNGIVATSVLLYSWDLQCVDVFSLIADFAASVHLLGFLDIFYMFYLDLIQLLHLEYYYTDFSGIEFWFLVLTIDILSIVVLVFLNFK